MRNATDLIGTEISGYRVTTCLGEGAVGLVYRAEHVADGRPVAIKVLKPEVARLPEMVIRFFQEARTIRAARHPNIVEILEFATEAEGPLSYIVMELLEGQSLAQRIASGGPFEPAEAVEVALQLAAALIAVHHHRALHRDLKPGNVFLTEDADGQTKVKLLDFGLAKSFGDGHEITVTMAGTPVGTPAYMAPEQVLGRPLDARADIYGLGVVMYEMLTGTIPFDSNEIGEVLIMQVKQLAPPLRERRTVDPPVSAALEAVVMRCLEKNPADRFMSVSQLHDALTSSGGWVAQRGLQSFETATLKLSGRQGRGWLGWALGAVGVALVALVALVAWRADIGDSPAAAAADQLALANPSPDASAEGELVRREATSSRGEATVVEARAGQGDGGRGVSTPAASVPREEVETPAVPVASKAVRAERRRRRNRSASRATQPKRPPATRAPQSQGKARERANIKAEPRPKPPRLIESTVDPFAEN